MTDQYVKVDGAWTRVGRPYVKNGGVWTPVQESWIKRSGAWVQAWRYDNTPPQIPELGLQIIDNRYIKCSARLPGGASDPQLKLIRILVSATATPTSQYGSGFITGGTQGYPGEAWSNWFYNNPGGSDHGDTSQFTFKYYPIDPTSSTNLPGAKWYYFSAWSLDFEGNWSGGNYAQIWMPKDGNPASNTITKDANIQPNSIGSVGLDTTVINGQPKVHNSPLSYGYMHYGVQFTQSVGTDGTPTIGTAKLRVTRANDSGQALANVRVGWTDSASPTAVDPTTFQEVAVLGTIQKGETKWFDLPTSWYGNFNTQIQGIGLVAGSGAADDVEFVDRGTDIRMGEVNLVWTEAL